MAQAAFLCESDGNDAVAVRSMYSPPTASLFGDEARLQDLGGDARRAGLAVRTARPLASVLNGDGGALGLMSRSSAPRTVSPLSMSTISTA